VDLVIAAAAEAAGLSVLHYDSDYDRIAAVTSQQCGSPQPGPSTESSQRSWFPHSYVPTTERALLSHARRSGTGTLCHAGGDAGWQRRITTLSADPSTRDTLGRAVMGGQGRPPLPPCVLGCDDQGLAKWEAGMRTLGKVLTVAVAVHPRRDIRQEGRPGARRPSGRASHRRFRSIRQ
jgi:hypothetical protein